jgi:hypothetical protein
MIPLRGRGGGAVRQRGLDFGVDLQEIAIWIAEEEGSVAEGVVGGR